MAEDKHTPGPWHVYRRADAKPTDLPWVAGHMGKPLAFVTHETILKEDIERAEANARLIAAAPDLLEACQRLLEELRLIRMKDSGAVYDVTCRMHAEAAIAKAEAAS